MSKVTTEIFIKRSNIIHNSKYKYEKSIYTIALNKVIITCPIHGDFEQRAASHMDGQGCVKCGIETNSKLMKSVAANKFSKHANAIHDNKYNYEKSVYQSNRTNISIICPIHGEFLQTPSNHLKGEGCRKCGYEYTANLKQSIASNKFVKQSNIIHNSKYSYEKSEYTLAVNKVIITCSIHGDFEQTVKHHLSGHGCKKCAKNLIIGGYNKKTIGKWGNIDGYFYKVILEHPTTGEMFNKVGITKHPKHRFQQYSPYVVNGIISLENMKLVKAFDNEQLFIKDMDKYIPIEKFSGYTECYK